ncbi:hypothetical protein GCM10009552_34330 [Rothia nasimurium]|uniref:Prepilin-type N-terminal cleavage/methylation domain-containing protein n=1 Tax=Luteibacter anthropi TaxID=564369 RepID=A0A7X5U8Q4_9GAMM|nr:prepilin-type N-terminal cleavage/methylation domain-containing protein [Luteibacter anthropi]NII05783.1 prepilin-type N-terminal cleavage/methylation domain-containing protein [Luteibacter anthropi]
MTPARGFSLLEVLAALALLALLLLGVYSGVKMTTVSVQRGTSAIDRLDALRGARDFLQRELSEATALPWAVDEKGKPVVFSGRSDELRFVAPLPGYLGQLGAQVVTLHLVEREGAQTMEVSFGTLPTSVATAPPVSSETLLGDLRGMRFRYADKGGAWYDHWSDRSTLPALVEIDTNDKDRDAAWPTLRVAPRESAAALNGAAIARGLGRDLQ